VLGKNSVIYAIGNIGLRGASFLLIPIYTHFLSVSDYGLLAILFMSIQLMLIFANLGMQTCLVRFTKEYEENDCVGVLVGRGEHKMFGVFTALTALLCVSGSIISLKLFDWGLLGVAWSNFLPMVLVSGLILPIYFNRSMKISAWDCILCVWWPALLGCLPSIVLICVWKYAAPPDSWIEIAGLVFATMVLTLLGSWFLSLKKIEKKRFVHIALRT